MRLFVYVYYGITFTSLSLHIKANLPVLNDEDIKNSPTYLSFMQAISVGQVNLSDSKTQLKLGFILLKTAKSMMNQTYHEAFEMLKIG
jgi:hypothetical protein